MNNEVSLIGNLTKDPEYRQLNSGKPVMSIRIAVNHKPTKDAEEEVLYMDVTSYNYLAEYAKGVNLSKGDKVVVKGRLQERSWLDSNGNKRYAVSVVANSLFKCEMVESVKL